VGVSKIQEVSLSMDDCSAMTVGVEYGCSLLGLAPGFSPSKAQPLIESFLERFRVGEVVGELDPLAAEKLGLFWGLTIALEYDWNWVSVAADNWRGFGVADLQRSYLALPMPYFRTLMHEESGWEIPGPSSRFRAIGAKHLPPSRPGALTIIAS
jgi:hypothetical protein